MPRLLLATTNAHKTAEVAAMLGEAWQVEDLRAHPGLTPAEETGLTFEPAQTPAARVEPFRMVKPSTTLELVSPEWK